MAADAVAAEIVNRILRVGAAARRDQQWTYCTDSGEQDWKPPPRWPACASCGGAQGAGSIARVQCQKKDLREQFEADRRLDHRLTGGVRVRSAGETVSDWTRHVDAFLGPVSWLATLRPADGWCHAEAWADTAGLDTSTSALDDSRRHRAFGKGQTQDEAAASALGEAIERHSAVWQGDESVTIATRTDLGDAAIDPENVLLISDRQYRSGVLGLRRFDPSAERAWGMLKSLTTGEAQWLPAEFLWFRHPTKVRSCPSDSNGIAAGNTYAEAVIQGFLELVERDAYAIWWANAYAAPPVATEQCGDLCAEQVGLLHRLGRNVAFLDVTTDLGIPAIAAVSWLRQDECCGVLVKVGAHFDPHIAAARAVGEILQYITVAQRSALPAAIGDWLLRRTLGMLPQLCSLGQEPVPLRMAPQTSGAELFELCREVAAGAGLELLVHDLTRPEIGVPVVRVVVPGLRHYWPRYAPGRLYDVPVSLGHLTAPRDETELAPPPPYLLPAKMREREAL